METPQWKNFGIEKLKLGNRSIMRVVEYYGSFVKVFGKKMKISDQKQFLSNNIL